MTETEFTQDFTDNLKEVMRRKGTNISELSRLSGVSRMTIHEMLKGKRLPSIRSIINIAYAMECDIEDLVYVEELIE